MRLIVTGGAGFIGSSLVQRALEVGHDVLTIDKLTYAGTLAGLRDAFASPRHQFIHADITSESIVTAAFRDFEPDAVLHLAAESHVDRSIETPSNFIETNVRGTFVLLNAALRHWNCMDSARRARFRFVHVSTDEVFGSLGNTGQFDLESRYAPNSPYAASKAAADHLARAWHYTYKLPIIVTNCSNNYGPRQHAEKFIPTVIRNALQGKPIPLYGDGSNTRDWLYVADHVNGLLLAATRGHPGDTYLFGGRCEVPNLVLANKICSVLDSVTPREDGCSYENQISFVVDRPGHDFRYAIDPSYAEKTLRWTAAEHFASALKRTVTWYLAERHWLMPPDLPERLGIIPMALGQ